MDLSSVNTREPADRGAFLHLRHPVTGELLMDGDEPVGVVVRGVDSPKIDKFLKQQHRRRLAAKNGAGEFDELEEARHFAQLLVIEFRNVHQGDRPLSANDPRDVEWFFEQSPDFVRQVTAFARDNANFFSGS